MKHLNKAGDKIKIKRINQVTDSSACIRFPTCGMLTLKSHCIGFRYKIPLPSIHFTHSLPSFLERGQNILGFSLMKMCSPGFLLIFRWKISFLSTSFHPPFSLISQASPYPLFPYQQIHFKDPRTWRSAWQNFSSYIVSSFYCFSSNYSILSSS